MKSVNCEVKNANFVFAQDLKIHTLKEYLYFIKRDTFSQTILYKKIKTVHPNGKFKWI